MKLIYTYDPTEDVFATISHNLSDGDADQQRQEMRGAGLPAYTLKQPRVHQTTDAGQCASCARLVRKALSPKPAGDSKTQKPARRATVEDRRRRRK